MTELICKTCQKKVPLTDIRSDKSGVGWICIVCYENQHPNVYKNIKPGEARTPLPKKIQKVRYYCSECGYKFDREIDFRGKCPYCNLYAVKEEKDAEALIKDSVIDEGIGSTRPRIEIVD